ncbi:hypothetical protein KC217_20545, partial [Mycobacterium tuberculosis]|nr:hypothetical protein [Mycobacterium tuberculosis]
AIIPVMVGLQIASFVVGGLLRTSEAAVPIAYVLPIACSLVCALALEGWIRFAVPQALTQLASSISRRMARQTAS